MTEKRLLVETVAAFFREPPFSVHHGEAEAHFESRLRQRHIVSERWHAVGFCLGKTPWRPHNDPVVIFKNAMTVICHGLICVHKLVSLYNFLCVGVISTQSSEVFLKWGYSSGSPAGTTWNGRNSPPSLNSILGLQRGTKEHLANIWN